MGDSSPGKGQEEVGDPFQGPSHRPQPRSLELSLHLPALLSPLSIQKVVTSCGPELLTGPHDSPVKLVRENVALREAEELSKVDSRDLVPVTLTAQLTRSTSRVGCILGRELGVIFLSRE